MFRSMNPSAGKSAAAGGSAFAFHAGRGGGGFTTPGPPATAGCSGPSATGGFLPGQSSQSSRPTSSTPNVAMPAMTRPTTFWPSRLFAFFFLLFRTGGAAGGGAGKGAGKGSGWLVRPFRASVAPHSGHATRCSSFGNTTVVRHFGHVACWIMEQLQSGEGDRPGRGGPPMLHYAR